VPARPEQVTEELSRALRDHAHELRIDPASIRSPSPHAVTARTHDGALFRLDYDTYPETALDR
jgi:hypothetical protein